jgi:osmotically-inducible protein OsmY
VLRASAASALLASALSGCALTSAVEKCGFQGCPEDAQITANVVSQCYRSSFLEPNAITVQTPDHVEYLNGAVASGPEITAAESIGRQVPGVARVADAIVVQNFR